MNKKFVVILLIMLCEIVVAVLCASANEINAPKPKPVVEHQFNKKVFWTGIGTLAAAKTADGITTARMLSDGFEEKDPIFGQHPSDQKIAVLNLGIFAAQAGAFYLTEHSRNKTVRWIGRLVLVGQIGGHAYATHYNTILKR